MTIELDEQSQTLKSNVTTRYHVHTRQAVKYTARDSKKKF